MDFFFPENVIFEILIRMPAKELIGLKLVCKSWYSLISSSNFVKYHLARVSSAQQEIIFTISTTFPKFMSLSLQDLTLRPLSSLDELSSRSKRVLGSCNGLLLLESPLSLYNPVTQKFKILPASPFRCESTVLVHDSLLDKYKVFGFVYDKCIVLTVGGDNNASDEWRDLEKFVYPSIFCTVSTRFTFTKNQLYWLSVVCDIDESLEGGARCLLCIFSVDVGRESSQKINIPTRADPVHYYHVSAVKGSLCLTSVSYSQLDIRILEDEVKCRWSAAYIVCLQSISNKPAFLDGFSCSNVRILCLPCNDFSDFLDHIKLLLREEDQLFILDLKNQDLKSIGYISKQHKLNHHHLYHSTVLFVGNEGRSLFSTHCI